MPERLFTAFLVGSSWISIVLFTLVSLAALIGWLLQRVWGQIVLSLFVFLLVSVFVGLIITAPDCVPGLERVC